MIQTSTSKRIIECAQYTIQAVFDKFHYESQNVSLRLGILFI